MELLNDETNRDYIYVATSDGDSIPFEVVTIYNIKDSEYNYIIYRNLERTDYYIAKYLGKSIVNLDTNLSEEEINIGQELLEEIEKNNDKT